MSYAIDVVFLLLAPSHPALIVLAIVQYLARRNATICRGFWQLAGCPGPSIILSSCLPGLVVPGGSGTGSVPPGTSSEGPVPPQQNQAEPAEPVVLASAINLIARHNLEPQAAAELLAVLQKTDGSYYLSANAIRDIVGGNAATVKAWVAAKRPPAEAEKAGSQGRWELQADGGWTKVR